MHKPLSRGHLFITDKAFGPNGVRFRGVPLYIHVALYKGQHNTCVTVPSTSTRGDAGHLFGASLIEQVRFIKVIAVGRRYI